MSQSPAKLVNGLAALDGKPRGSLSASKRTAVHRDKAALVAEHNDLPVRGTTYAAVFPTATA